MTAASTAPAETGGSPLGSAGAPGCASTSAAGGGGATSRPSPRGGGGGGSGGWGRGRGSLLVACCCSGGKMEEGEEVAAVDDAERFGDGLGVDVAVAEGGVGDGVEEAG